MRLLLKHYKLREQPFGVTPDPRYLYASACHLRALSSLLFSYESGLGCASLIAEPGLGKTTLLRCLLERIGPSTRNAFIFETQCNSRELLRHVLCDFGAGAVEPDINGMFRNFRDLLLRSAHEGRRLVLIIDEAQNLATAALETIRLLSNFETATKKLVHIVLAGQPRLAETLARPDLAQLRQRVITRVHLEPLSGAAVAEYINYRLQVAGYSGPALFTEDAIALVAEQSGGIPREINRICFNAMSLCCCLESRSVDAAIVRNSLTDTFSTLPAASDCLASSTSPQVLSQIPPCAGNQLSDDATSTTTNADHLKVTPRHPSKRHSVFQRSGTTTYNYQPERPIGISTARTAATQSQSERESDPASALYHRHPEKWIKGHVYAALAVVLIAEALIALVFGMKSLTRRLSSATAAAPYTRARIELSTRPTSLPSLPPAPTPKSIANASNSEQNTFSTLAPIALIAREVRASRLIPARLNASRSLLSKRMYRPDKTAVHVPSPTPFSTPQHEEPAVNSWQILRSSNTPLPVLPAPTRMPITLTTHSSGALSGPTAGFAGGKLLTRVGPQYPQQAKTLRVTGEVVLKVHIARDGRVSEIQIVRGNSLLAAAASDAVRRWIYQPFTINGDPVEVESTVIVNFAL